MQLTENTKDINHHDKIYKDYNYSYKRGQLKLKIVQNLGRYQFKFIVSKSNKSGEILWLI